MTYFLPHKSHRSPQKDKIALAERYFQKGNNFWAIQGMLDFYRPRIFGDFTWKKHIGAMFRSVLGADLIGVDDPLNGGTVNLNIRGAFELFWSFTDNIYGSALVGGQISSSGNAGLSGQIFPKGHYFFQNAFIELGYNFRFPLEEIFEQVLDTNVQQSAVTGAIVIAGEYFIQNNLSLRAEFGVNTFKDNDRNVVVFSTVPDNYLKFGINYFFTKKQFNSSEEDLYFND